MSDMGTFRTDVELENPAQPGVHRLVSKVLVDTGSELSWIPAPILESLGIRRSKLWRFRQADGTALERWAGAALLYAGGTVTNDEVAFGEPGDMVLLGARSLEGLNTSVACPAPQRSTSTARRPPRQLPQQSCSAWPFGIRDDEPD
jgi:hypothetical protein